MHLQQIWWADHPSHNDGCSLNEGFFACQDSLLVCAIFAVVAVIPALSVADKPKPPTPPSPSAAEVQGVTEEESFHISLRK
ncbi:hypothetical protein BGZ82_010346, partial [Podila clonocystis]